jgi:quercetin dioxygenase-like cupin family protein
MKLRNVDAMREVTARPGVHRKSFSGEHATVAWTTLEPGHAPLPHAHPEEQISHILSGRVRFVVGDDAVEMGPGDTVVVPPNVRHWAEVIGDEPAVDLTVFGPRRDDYAAEE